MAIIKTALIWRLLAEKPLTLRELATLFVQGRQESGRVYKCHKCGTEKVTTRKAFSKNHKNPEGGRCRASLKWNGEKRSIIGLPKNIKSIENSLRQNHLIEPYIKRRTLGGRIRYSLDYDFLVRELGKRTDISRWSGTPLNVAAQLIAYCREKKLPFIKLIFDQAAEDDEAQDFDSWLLVAAKALACSDEGIKDMRFISVLKQLRGQCKAFLNRHNRPRDNILETAIMNSGLSE